MKVDPSTMSVTEYLGQIRAGTVVVNEEYQRSDRIWPAAAKSYLIDTLLEGYPVPKIFLRQTYDLRTNQLRKEVVDGQQRSYTLLDFFDNKFRLSQGKWTGANYESLPDNDKQRVSEYTLTFDVFTNTTPEEVREVFRRMNAYMVPLNAQELRHASRQGAFKWFINGLTEDYSEVLQNWGILSQRQLARMTDAELLADITGALVDGIQTGTKGYRDNLYKDHDKSFDQGQWLDARIADVFGKVPELQGLVGSALMTREHFYSLALAIAHASTPVERLSTDLQADVDAGINPTVGSEALSDMLAAAFNLSLLSTALTSDDVPPVLSKFVEESKRGGTNTKKGRTLRFQYFYKALRPEPLG